jgi:DNA/RNA endonuclease G (NUC1)
MMNFYEVTFDTKKGYPKSWIIHIEAENLKAAKNKAEEMWYNDNRLSDMHMFHVSCRKLKDTEEFRWHYFAIVGK